VNYSVSEYTIGDFSSRTSDAYSEILEVPIVDSTEFFLVASRRKISYYDRIMWGDTAHDDPYRNINPEYGKGVYIYHTPSSYFYPPYMDQECADGLYDYVLAGYEHPDWSSEQLLPFYIKEAVSFNNDKSLGRITDADGKSIFGWFGIGKKHSCLYCDGTDRIYSNSMEIWTSREGMGDRWDAWNVGYNEVFSPYSSPSTKNWNSEETGIFIWYYELDLFNNAKFKIYRAGYGGYSQEDILRLTPPSRPMGLKVSLTDCINDFQYPVLTWLHNMEPDMINPQVPPEFTGKWYRIYIAKTAGNSIPDYYTFLAFLNADSSEIPQFVDYQIPIPCTGTQENINIRYVITAVDGTGWESVRSDFAAISINASGGSNRYSLNNLLPSKYTLFQNYPNPFNPATVIKFEIHKSGFVKLAVYNLLGEEVALLVNEQKSPGSYTAVFNGYRLPSGVYFYRIEASTFTDSKKMVLVK
jgi:hypothetical protein